MQFCYNHGCPFHQQDNNCNAVACPYRSVSTGFTTSDHTTVSEPTTTDHTIEGDSK